MPTALSQNQGPLLERVTLILEQAYSNIVRSVNHNMVMVYWMIGREIVEAVQEGEERAKYGEQIIENLSMHLTKKYNKGFSTTNLRYFRKFYQAYPDRLEIQHLSGAEFKNGFHPDLSWSHYRALMRLKNYEARKFYEMEAVECGWSKAQLERQIHTSYYERLLKNNGKNSLLPAKRERLAGEALAPVQLLKSPYILEFLNLPDHPGLHEKELEKAIINNLQAFLLKLGKGFSYVARQKHIRYDDDDFYVDLVFYNFILKCFLLIDLKIGKLTHRDVGQMDGYVRLFEDRFKVSGDNPTVGLILCSDKSETVAKYSVLKESKQLFAARYMLYLPSEEELQQVLEREIKLIEENRNIT